MAEHRTGKKKRKRGLIIVSEKKKSPKNKPKNQGDVSSTLPMATLLPEVIPHPPLKLVVSSILTSVKSPPLRFDADFIPPPPAVTGVFTFETLAYDEKKRVTRSIKGTARFYREYILDDVWLELVEIPSGNFIMGAPANEPGSQASEQPQHNVTIPQFWIGKYEVTQGQWRAVAKLPKVNINLKPISDLNPDPSYFKGDDNLPVEQVTWDQAVEFCARLSKKTGKLYRLPTETEWEYTARAQTKTPFAFGETITPKIVNYNRVVAAFGINSLGRNSRVLRRPLK